MPSLMDTIKSSMAQQANPNAMAKQGQLAADTATSQAAQLSQASTGKAGQAGTTPKASALAASAAAGQANVGAQQLAQQVQIQGQALKQQEAAQEQQATQAGRELDEQQLSMHETYANRASELVNQLTRGRKELDVNKQRAAVEHATQMARLANDQYVTQLETEATKARLDDEATFQFQLNNAVFADLEDLLQHDMDFRIAMNGKQNDWNEYLGSISLEHALDISKSNARAANTQMIWGAVGQGIDTGTQAASMAAGMPRAPAASVPGRAPAGPAQYQQEAFAPGQRGDTLEPLNPEPAPTAASRYGSPSGMRS